MAQVGGWRAPRDLIELMELALDAVCTSAQKMLGVVTLKAIVDRVLFNAREGHPFLADLTFESSKFDSKKMLAMSPLPDEAQAKAALRFVLVELLTVLGNLTAEILTPAFHGALTTLAAASSVPPTEGRTSGEAKDK
jgi:hypothetical protein